MKTGIKMFMSMYFGGSLAIALDSFASSRMYHSTQSETTRSFFGHINQESNLVDDSLLSLCWPIMSILVFASPRVLQQACDQVAEERMDEMQK